MKIVSFVTCCCPEVKERVDDSPLCGSVDNVWDSAGRPGEDVPTVSALNMNSRTYSAQVSLTRPHSSVWLAPG